MQFPTIPTPFSHFLLLLPIALLTLLSCNKDDEPSEFPNLIANGDFETPLEFSANGWTAVGEYQDYVRVPAICPDGGQNMLTLNGGNGTSPRQLLYYNAIVPEQGPFGLRLSMDYHYDADYDSIYSTYVVVGVTRRSQQGNFNLGSFLLLAPYDTCLTFSTVFSSSWLKGDTAQVQLGGNKVRIDNLELRRDQ